MRARRPGAHRAGGVPGEGVIGAGPGPRGPTPVLKRLLRADLARGAIVAIALAGLIALAATLMSARKVIQRAHGGILLGSLMCGWTAVQPLFSRAKRASRRPGRGGAGRRGPRDRRVTAEHVT